MRARIWMAGLAVILAGSFVSASAQERSTQDPRRPFDPVFRVAAGDAEDSYESASATNVAVLRRNIIQDLEVRDTLVYCLQGADCGDSCASLMILNISDPTLPKFVSRLRFHGGAAGGFNLKLVGNYVYLTIAAPEWTSILYVVDVSNQLSPTVVGSYPFPAYATGIDVANERAYIVDGIGSQGHSLNVVHILDVGNPAQIAPLKDIPTDYRLSNIRNRGDYTLAVGQYELYIINTFDLGQARVVSRVATGQWPIDLDFGESDTLVYVADMDNFMPASVSALTVINIADPDQPEILRQSPLYGMVVDVKVQGHWAFVTNGVCGVQVFDISDPTAPDSVARYQMPRQAGRLALEDSLLLVTDIFVIDGEYYYCESPTPGQDDPQEGDLVILNIADPTNPTLLGFYRPTAQDPTGIDDVESEVLPTSFALYQNYPNPFNPGTMVEFDLPVRAEVELSVYNLLGQEVTRLVQSRSAGHHTIQLNMRDQASGVYFYELRANEYSGTGKMLLLK